MSVLVVIRVHDDHLESIRAIKSVIQSDYSDFRILLVMQKPSLRLLDAISFIRTNEPRLIRVISTEHDPIQGLNLVAHPCFAKHEYLAILDCDDIMVRKRLTKQVAFLTRKPEYVIVGSFTALIDHQSGRLLFNKMRYPIRDKSIRRKMTKAVPFSHPSIMMRRSTLLEVGGYKGPHPYEDYELYRRILKKGKGANSSKRLTFYSTNKPLRTDEKSYRMGSLILETVLTPETYLKGTFDSDSQ